MFILLLITGYFIVNRFLSCRRLSCLDIMGFEKYQVKDIYTEDDDSYRAMYKNTDKIIRLEVQSNINEDDAQKYIDASVARMRGLFTEAASPYPGVISDEITCDKTYQPTFQEITNSAKVDVSYFTGYLNQNLVFGSCSESQAVYKGILSYFYCPRRKQAFQLELIAPVSAFNKSGFKETIDSIRCK